MTNQTTTRSAEIQHAREVDAQVAAKWAAYWNAMAPADTKRLAIKDLTRSLRYARTAESRDRYQERIEAANQAIAQITADAAPFAQAARDFDRENYEGWQRFFLVEHIHSSQHCSSFRPTTKVGWLPNLSGLTEAEAVTEHGAILCTICFPSAPTEWTMGKVDPNVCTGQRDYNKPSRQGYVTGNWGTCSECGQAVTLTSAGNLRKHKPQETK